MRSMFLLCLLFPAARLAGQAGPSEPGGRWAVGVTLGTFNYEKSAEGTGETGERVTYLPWRPLMWGVAAARGGDRFRFVLSARYGSAGLALRGTPAGATAPLLLVGGDAYHVLALAAGAGTRLVRLHGGPAVRPSLSALLERWRGQGSRPRTILGVQGGLAIEAELSRAFIVSVEGEIGFTPKSPFRQEDLPEGLERRSTWRRSVSAGLSWRF